LVIGGNFNLNIVVRAKEYRWRYKVGGEFHNYKHVVTPKVIQYINVSLKLNLIFLFKGCWT